MPNASPRAVGAELDVPLGNGGGRARRGAHHGGGCRRAAHRGIRVVNDAYNANPESVAAALKTGRWMAARAIDRGPRTDGGARPDRHRRARTRWASLPPGSRSTGSSRSDRTRKRSRSRPSGRVEPDAAVAYDDPDAAIADVLAAAPGDVVVVKGPASPAWSGSRRLAEALT